MESFDVPSQKVHFHPFHFILVLLLLLRPAVRPEDSGRVLGALQKSRALRVHPRVAGHRKIVHYFDGAHAAGLRRRGRANVRALRLPPNLGPERPTDDGELVVFLWTQ